MNGINGASPSRVAGAGLSAATENVVDPDALSPSLVIAQATANLDEQRRAERQVTQALRRAGHEATERRVHHMRKAADHALVGALVGASATAAGALVGVGAAENSNQAALGKAIGQSGTAGKGIADRFSALDNTRAELARDQAQAASEQASDAASDAENSRRMADKALGHLSEIQQQINRGREAAIRG